MNNSDHTPEPAAPRTAQFAAVTRALDHPASRVALRMATIGALTLALGSAALAAKSRWEIQQRLAGLAVEIAEEIFDAKSHGRLLLYAHPQLFTYTPELDWPSRLFEQRSRLGELQSIDSLTTNFEQSVIRAFFDSAPNSVSYHIQSRFNTGPAIIEIIFTEQASEWLVSQLLINSEALRL